jgi:hypothetical protein
MKRDIYDPIVDVIGLLEGVTVSGPDFDGCVALTSTPPDGNALTIALGRRGEPAAEAALRWRNETVVIAGEVSPEEDRLRDILHHMDIHGPFGGDIGT